jgi:hypothetical protein
MWCVGILTEQYQRWMCELVDHYARSWCVDEPVICEDERSKQLLGEGRPGLPIVPGTPVRGDYYQYVRSETSNVFVAVEPRGARPVTQVTDPRGKADFVAFVQYLVDTVYRSARRIHLVVNNLSNPCRVCIVQVHDAGAAHALRHGIFPYTPKHAGWLNMAEIENSAIRCQCPNRRIGDQDLFAKVVAAWQKRCNAEHRTFQWTFTRQNADRKLGRHYVSKLTG